jgi:uncharacterized membrane-anchored protein
MTKTLTLLMAFLATSASIFAREPEDSLKMLMDELKAMDSIENTLHYKTGKIELSSGIAAMNIPASFKFLDAAEAKYVLEDLWGNPGGHSPLGMIFPANSGATDPGSYAFVIQYEELGFVKDSDADKINYDDLLKELKESSDKENKERLNMGLVTMDLVGWAAKPYYDKEKKVLHWAKEYSVPGRDENTLNYDIRVLGRKGVLTLQAVSAMDQLDSVNNHINDVLAMVSFNEGHRYADFDSKTDEVAAWTIGGLVAGKVLAKAGFFAVILKFLKFILVGLALVGGAIWKFITGRKKKEEEFVYEPQPAPASQEPNNPPV